MDLTKLFEAQKKLDAHIEKEKGLQGVDLLDKKILALQVELGELANNWRGFKFWSEDQEPKTFHYCEFCGDSEELCVYDFDESLVDIPCFICEEVSSNKNPLLEEYVDCLHFILSIGNDLGFAEENLFTEIYRSIDDLVAVFIEVKTHISDLYWEWYHNGSNDYGEQLMNYRCIFSFFMLLGEMLGFTWEQIEQSYYEKNRINHERQLNGY